MLSGTDRQCCRAALFHRVRRNWWRWQLRLITQLLLTGLTGLRLLFLLPPSPNRMLHFLCWCFSSWIHDSVSTVPSLCNFYFCYLTTDFLPAFSVVPVAWAGAELGCASGNTVCHAACGGRKLPAEVTEVVSAGDVVYVADVFLWHFIGWEYVLTRKD